MLARRAGLIGTGLLVLILVSPAGRAAKEDDARELLATVTRARALEKNGQIREALRHYEKAVLLAERVHGPDAEVTAGLLIELGVLCRDAENYARAEQVFKRALRIHEVRLGRDHPAVAATLNDLALVYQEQGRHDEAEPLLRRCLHIRERCFRKDHPAVAQSLNNLAALYQEQGRFTEAEPLCRRCLRLRETYLGKDHLEVADALNNLAALHRAQGRPAEAEGLFRRSLHIRETRLGKDHPDVAESLNNLAVLCDDQGRFAEAEPLYRRCLRIREARKDHRAVADTLNNLAVLHWNLGRLPEAEPLFRRSLTIRETRWGKEHPAVAESLNNLAGLYQALGRPADAESLYRRSLQIRERRLGRDHPGVAAALNNLGVLYEGLGRRVDAEPLYRRSLEIRAAKLGPDHPAVAQSLDNLVGLLGTGERWDEATAAADRARRILRRHVHRVLPGLSESQQLAFLKTRVEAGFHIALSLALRRGRADAGLRVRSAGWVLNGKALAQQALAERALLAHDGGDPASRQAAGRLLEVRQRLAALTLAPLRPGEERRRRRQLELLAGQEQQRSKEFALARGEAPRNEPWVEVAEVRQALPPGAVLIDIARIPLWNFQARGQPGPWQAPRYAAWVIPAQGAGDVQLVDLGEAGAIDQVVQTVRRDLQQALVRLRRRGEPEAERELRQSLAALARKVLHPLLAAHLGKKERWLISPDGLLWLVPWAALPLPDGRYAIEQHRISYLVSGRDVVRGPAPRSKGRALVLADPDFDFTPTPARRQHSGENRLRSGPSRGGLPQVRRLPGTAAEARAIGPPLARWCRAEPRICTGPQALEGVVKTADRPRVVALCTHAFFLEDQEALPPWPARSGDRGLVVLASPRPRAEKVPVLENPLLRCGLFLAGCNRRAQLLKATGDDGVLTGLEVVGCDLRGTELVVLSACDTGLGKVRNGEGVAGLRQAFQLAGARAVLATLWQVPDRETARLMSDFFAALAGGRDGADALRAAQLALIKARRSRSRGAHPFFWAAFTLTGSPQ
jgi:CHAT domain-containing protein/tetratricopeptide (TPR) repeat protein